MNPASAKGTADVTSAGEGDGATEALVARIQRDLDEDGIYLGPGARQVVDADDVAALQAASAAADQPIFVVVRPFTQDDAFGGQAGDLLARVHDASGEPGIYLANRNGLEGAVSVELRQWQDLDAAGGPAPSIDDNDVYAVGMAAAPGDLGAQLVTVAEEIADGTLAETADALYEAEYGGVSEGTDSGDVVGLVLLGLVVLALVLGVAVLIRSLLGRRSRKRDDGPGVFVLPSVVSERLRAADDVTLRRTADREVLELGEALDESTMQSDAGQEAWQAALDHYAEGRKLLESDDGVPGAEASPDPTTRLDTVGAVVLARRGQEALDHALAGREWSPTKPCLLHPLHGPGATTDTLDVQGRPVRAPLCRDCHRTLARGGRPDLLLVHDDDTARSYLETDAEPWVRTGFGALDPDLVTALHRRRSG